MDAPKNILLIRLKSIGDVVLTLPAVSVLRRNFPGARLTFLTSKENVSLLRGFAGVSESIALDRAALRSGNPAAMSRELIQLLRRLRGGKFSLVVDFQGNGESAWLTRIAGAPQRWCAITKAGRGWAYTRTTPRRNEIHAAEMQLNLLSHCGLDTSGVENEFRLPEDALSGAMDFFAAHKLEPSRPTLFLQPFTSVPHKNWPLDNYLDVARHWQARGMQIVFGGGPADRAALGPALKEGFAVSAGVPLLVTGGLMKLSTLVLGGDTGALHLAVAMGKRVLMLMHEVSSGSPVPFRHSDWVIVAPRPEAMAEIPAAEVNIAIAQIFSAPADNVSC